MIASPSVSSVQRACSLVRFFDSPKSVSTSPKGRVRQFKGRRQPIVSSIHAWCGVRVTCAPHADEFLLIVGGACGGRDGFVGARKSLAEGASFLVPHRAPQNPAAAYGKRAARPQSLLATAAACCSQGQPDRARNQPRPTWLGLCLCL